jgi:hypothetical protein
MDMQFASLSHSYDACYLYARLLKRLDFAEMKFSLYFLGYEVTLSEPVELYITWK